LKTLNALYSTPSTRRRYEVWFLRLGLADDSGAWWFRYLLMNLGKQGCLQQSQGMPVQIWATWFPRAGKPRTFIQGFPADNLQLSPRSQSPFHMQIADNAIDENSCRGAIDVDGHSISWDLAYRSTFHVTISSKGWIGFSRTPHSDATFSGKITFDGHTVEGDPIGFGLQGHNCGYRHRNFWTWSHVYVGRGSKPPTTLEALQYEMPLGLTFRKAVLWHCGIRHTFTRLKGELMKGSEELRWHFICAGRDGSQLDAIISGVGSNTHYLPYLKTDCSGSFEVANNSLAGAVIRVRIPGLSVETLETSNGAVLEAVGL
jgi:hypothetical protein